MKNQVRKLQTDYSFTWSFKQNLMREKCMVQKKHGLKEEDGTSKWLVLSRRKQIHYKTKSFVFIG